MHSKFFELARYLLGNLPQGAAAFAATVCVFSSFWVVGRLLSRSSSADNVLVGWGVAYLLSLAAAYVGVTNLKIVMGTFAFLMLIAVVRLVRDRKERLRPASGSSALLVMLPVIGFAFLIPSLHIDSYYHWLPNAARLFQLDRFPLSPHPGFLSLHPTYPMALALCIYCASVLAAGYLELAGNMTNVLLSTIAVATLIDFVGRAAATDRAMPRTFMLPVIAFCAAVSLNPSFTPTSYWSATADAPMALIVMILAARWCSFVLTPKAQCVDASSSGTKDNKELVALFLMAALLAGVKNNGWMLALISAASFSAVGIRERLEIRRLAMSGLAVCTGAIVSSLLWSTYVAKTSFPKDQFSISPLAQWRFDLMDELAVAMLGDFKANYVYYGVVFAVVLCGLLFLLRPQVCPNRNVRVVMGFVSLAMLMHLAALFLAYLGGGFSDDEIVRAASLQRYSTHVGFSACAIGLTVFALGLSRYGRAAAVRSARAWVRPGILVLYSVGLIGGIGVPALRWTRSFQNGLAQTRFFAEDALSAVPKGNRVAIVGEYWSVRLFAYLAQILPQAPEIAAAENIDTAAQWNDARERYAMWTQDPSIANVVLIDAESIAIDLGIGPHSDLIWSRETNQWQILQLHRPDPYRFGGEHVAQRTANSSSRWSF
jgi:hypothetical protein